MKVGQLAKVTEVNVETIRYYQHPGLAFPFENSYRIFIVVARCRRGVCEEYDLTTKD